MTSGILVLPSYEEVKGKTMVNTKSIMMGSIPPVTIVKKGPTRYLGAEGGVRDGLMVTSLLDNSLGVC